MRRALLLALIVATVIAVFALPGGACLDGLTSPCP